MLDEALDCGVERRVDECVVAPPMSEQGDGVIDVEGEKCNDDDRTDEGNGEPPW